MDPRLDKLRPLLSALKRKQGYGWHGHFLGFRTRLNCENMPVIPAWLVRSNLDDPRKIPYLLVLKLTQDRDFRLMWAGEDLSWF